jgi:hypothetical protein
MIQKCKSCGSTIQPRRLDEIRGQDGDIIVRLLDYPVLTCSENHEQRHIESLTHLTRHFSAVIQPLLTTKRGIPFFQRHLCCKCRRSLDRVIEQPDRLELTVDLRGYSGIRLQYEGPALRCRYCGTVQIRNIGRHVMSIARALTAAWGT